MASTVLVKQFKKELEAEAPASRKCLERIPDGSFGWKPHEKSMAMGYLASIVAEIPRWISMALEVGEINFATFKHAEMKNAADLVAEFDRNMEGAKKVLENISDEDLNGIFQLKMKDKILISETKRDTLSSSINHLVHHRGQLTIYFRLNNIPVPSIYGPSADEGKF